MKWLLGILLALLCYSFIGTNRAINSTTLKRDTVPTGAAPQLFGGKLYEFKNYVLIDSFLLKKGGDTFATPRWPAIQFKTSDRGWYEHDSLSWKRFITTDIQNVQWCNVKLSGADTTGALDASPFIQSLIDRGCKVIYAPSGTYLLSSTIQMKDSITIIGDGRSTRFKITKNIPGFKCSWSLGGNNAQFKDFSFIGSYSDSTLQDGIFADSANSIYVTNIAASRLAGWAVRMRKAGYCCAVYPTPEAIKGNVITDCFFDSCYGGVKADTIGEFLTVANTTVSNGIIGIFTAAGSTNISSCRLGGNDYGIYMTGGSNNSHGTCENTHIPHSKTYGIYITGTTNGYRFVGNMIRQNFIGEIYMENSDRIMFEHNDIGAKPIVINGCTNTKFIDNLYWGPPTWSITGTAPTVIQNGETQNAMSIKDIVNNNQGDIKHSNNVIDINTTSLGKIRLNDTVIVKNVLAGGESPSDTLGILSTTSASAPGNIVFGTDIGVSGIVRSVYVPQRGQWGFGTNNPSVSVHIRNAKPGFNSELRISEDIACTSCGARILLGNEGNATTGQIFVGSTTNAFMPTGMMMHSTGSTGLKFATNGSSGQDIEFAGSVSIGVNSWGRFKGGTGSFLFATTTDDPTTGRFQIHSRSRFDSLVRMYNVTAPPATYSVMVHGLTDSGTYQVPLSDLAATTIYTGDGTLAADRTVSTGGFTTTWTGSNDSETSFSVANTGTTNANAISGSATGTTSIGVSGTSSAYIGVYGSSTSNNGVQGQSSSGTGVVGVSSTGAAFRGQTNPTSTNAIENILTLLRTSSSGAGANGIGAAIQFELETATSGTSQTAGSVAFKFTDATNATRTSQFVVTGVNNATDGTLLTVDGDGSMTTTGRRYLKVTTSGAGTLTLANSESYVFTGTTTTWTLPAVSGTTGLIYYIKNRGSGAITLNAAAAANEIYSTSAVNTYTINAGEAIVLISDGTYFLIN